jgi:antitoxin component YwqK of YwqJK toxin-antitoxin module
MLGQTTQPVFDSITRTEKYFHENGQVKYEIIHLDKILDKHRHIIGYYKNGQKSEEFFDKNHVVYDTLRKWNESGKLNYLEAHSDTGYTTIEYWSESGRIATIGQYKISNQPIDKLTIYDSTTYDIYVTEKYDNPCYVRTGTWKTYYENGNLESEGQYYPMKFTFTTPTRDSSNVAILTKKTSFETIPDITYIVCSTYLENGLWIYYNDKGQKPKEVFYKNGQPKTH